MLIGANKGTYRLAVRDDFMVNVLTVCNGIIGLWLRLWFVRLGTHYINIEKIRFYWLLTSMMEQNYVADGSFKKRILVGIKLSRYLVVRDLALIKDLLPRV